MAEDYKITSFRLDSDLADLVELLHPELEERLEVPLPKSRVINLIVKKGIEYFQEQFKRGGTDA